MRGTRNDPRKRKLLPDEVSTQLTQALAKRSDVTFEVRKNSTVVHVACCNGRRVPKGLNPDPRHTR